jgi:hypothetical protein
MVRVGALVALMGCASTSANSAARYDDGKRAFAARSWQTAIDAFEEFKDKNCGADPRCTEARVAIAESYLRLGLPRKAFYAAEAARQSSPNGGSVNSPFDRVQKGAQGVFAWKIERPPGQGTISVLFKSEPFRRLRLKSVRFFLDLQPLATDNTVPYVAGTAVLAIPPTQVSLGDHELGVFVTFEGTVELEGYVFSDQLDFLFDVTPENPIAVEVRVVPSSTPYSKDPLRIEFLPSPRHEESCSAQTSSKTCGALPKSDIVATVHSSIPALRECYEANGDRGIPEQRIMTTWTIGADGSVSNLHFEDSPFQHLGMLVCLRRVISTWRFPSPHGVIDIRHPLVFRW